MPADIGLQRAVRRCTAAAEAACYADVKTNMDDPARRYRQLFSDRKACRQCKGLLNGSTLREGELDSAEIGPWTRWLGDLAARVLVIGQDWGDQRAFEKLQGLNDPSATNKMLRKLLASVGVQVRAVGMAAGPSGVCLTNAVLCFKDQGCQGAVRSEWFRECRSAVLPVSADVRQKRKELQEEILADGLLMRSGNQLAFAHLSFQEFLAAACLMGEPKGRRASRVLSENLLGDDWWLEVLKCYIGLSAKPKDLTNWFEEMERKVPATAREKAGLQVGRLLREVRIGFPELSE